VAERGRRLGSVRLRTTAGATLVVGVALAGAALLLVAVVHRSVTSNVQAAAELRAADVVALVEEGDGGTDPAGDDRDSSLVQVIDRRGRVVTASPDLEGEGPMARLRPGEARSIRLSGEDRHGYRVVAAAATTPDGPVTVLAARSLDEADEAVHAISRLLWLGLPGLVALVAATTWVVTGRSLRPVEAIRRQVAAITESELDRRVPVPGDDEVGRLAATMNEMLARLERSRDRQRRFVSDASHELRSPIATMRHRLDVALAHPGTRDDSLLPELLAEDLRMERLVDDMLTLARGDEEPEVGAQQPVDLDDLVLAEARRLRRRGRVAVRARSVSGSRVMGDAAALSRVLRNLTDNAERHARTTVGLELRVDDGRALCLVDDDGAGIPVADRPKAFERFTRLDDARAREVGGAGLGLAIAAEVVAAHAGSLRIEESPLGGARLVVDLPAVDAT
jgi:signal transduction histidine kinase